MEALMEAARRRDMQMEDIESAINLEGKNVVAAMRDRRRRTLLHFAADQGRTDLCVFLITEVGIKVDAVDRRDETPLMVATRQCYMETVECLLNYGADPCFTSVTGPTILCEAARNGNLGVMTLILDKGIHVDAQGRMGTALSYAAASGKIDAVRFLIERNAKVQPEVDSGYGLTPLYAAFAAGSLECFKILIENGADRSLIKHPLHAASGGGNVALVQWFLDAGADPNNCDDYGFRPLCSAIAAGSLACFETLLEKGADPSLIKDPLHAASGGGNVALVQWFIDHGADLDSSDAVDGLKPIQVAALRNHVEVIEYLLPRTTYIPGVSNWTIAGIIDCVEKEMKDVPHKEATLTSISSVKMNVSNLSDEDINKKISQMVPVKEIQFFSEWSAVKKRLFYETTLYGLPKPKQIVDYDVGKIRSSVIFDITSKNPVIVQASYLRAITVYRLWHFAGSDTVYELGPGGKKVTVSRKDGTFIFWFRCGKYDVGPVIDGQTVWVHGFLRRTRNDDGSFTYSPPIQFRNPPPPGSEHIDTKYLVASDLLVADCRGSYSGKVSLMMLDAPTVRSSIKAISTHHGKESFKTVCQPSSDILILYSTEAGKNYWAYQYIMKSLGKNKPEKPISIPSCLDGTVTNHQQVSESALMAIERIIGKPAKDGADTPAQTSANTDTAPNAAAAEEAGEEKEKKGQEEAYKIVTGVPFRKLSQCLDAYIILRRLKTFKTRFFLPYMESEFKNQESVELVKEEHESVAAFKERVLTENFRRGTIFTIQEHAGIKKYRGELWPWPMPPRPYSEKKAMKVQWYYLV
ncbi:hypothetical protein ACQ4PT_010071 [Festuca glaucescens]